MLTYYLYRLAGVVVPLIPPRLGYWLSARLGEIICYAARKARRNVRSNVAHVLGEKAQEKDVRKIIKEIFRNSLKNYFDLFRMPALQEEEVNSLLIEAHGWEHIDQALAAGKGLILVSAHFGNLEAFFHLAALRLGAITIPVEHIQPETLFRYICRLRESRGIELFPVDGPLLKIFRVLRNNGIVALAADRDITESGIVVDFFGAPARLPDGHVQLAMRTGAKLIVCFGIRRSDNTCSVYIEPPLELESSGDFAADVEANVKKLVAVLERYIARHPEQWVMFQPIWGESCRNKATAGS